MDTFAWDTDTRGRSSRASNRDRYDFYPHFLQLLSIIATINSGAQAQVYVHLFSAPRPSPSLDRSPPRSWVLLIPALFFYHVKPINRPITYLWVSEVSSEISRFSCAVHRVFLTVYLFSSICTLSILKGFFLGFL